MNVKCSEEVLSRAQMLLAAGSAWPAREGRR